jgi:hypothetical protein
MRHYILGALIVVFAFAFDAQAWEWRECTWGCQRDAAMCSACVPPPCQFVPVMNPCAVPCRPPELQPQAVPCAFKTACPSIALPCYGVSYTDNPYPIFK